MKFLLVGGISTLIVIGGLFWAPHSFGQTQAATSSDFATAVQAGLQALATNPVAQYQQQQIQSQDYKSTWDEFGTNVLIDGATPPAEVSNQVIRDITQSAEAAQNYDQQEASYLQAQQITPEQIQSSEQSVGSDLPPAEQIDANPSISANPDVNISPADVSVPESNASSSETEANNINASTSTSEISTTMSAVEINVSPTTSTIPTAGLEIANSVDYTTPWIGATVNYTLTVSALGPDASTEVTATDILPTGITFVDSTSSLGIYDSSTGIWSIGDMAASSTTKLVITAMVDASNTLGQSISNTATVRESSGEINPDQANASSTAIITVVPSDTMIFDAILQGEQGAETSTSMEINILPSAEPTPESSPTEPVPTP